MDLHYGLTMDLQLDSAILTLHTGTLQCLLFGKAETELAASSELSLRMSLCHLE